MCGINGVVSRRRSDADEVRSQLERMNAAIHHRGPDDSGVVTNRDEDCVVGLGMQRLSIIDLVSGHQPMQNAAGDVHLVFNGEIYNYPTLRAQLQERGRRFATTSDTEVILQLYEEEGSASFSRLDGMFAVALHDTRNHTLVLARDYFGEKPLYYRINEEGLMWASELKSLVGELGERPEISREALNVYFRLGYIPAPLSIYEGIYKLPCDSVLEYNLRTHEYHITEIPHPAIETPQIDSLDEATAEVRRLVHESVQSRSISDVPLGSFLSGGVDSSIITACLAEHSSSPVQTFSISYENQRYDESNKARTVVSQFNCDHHEFLLTDREIQPLLETILTNFDEPFADNAALPTHFLSLKTREHVKVALTGDGGDEVFAGYNKHYMGRMNRIYTQAVPRSVHSRLGSLADRLLTTRRDKRGKRFRLRKLLNAVDYDGRFYWNIISQANNQADLERLMRSEMLLEQPFERYQNSASHSRPHSITDFRSIDRLISLEGSMLPKVDRASMLASLECRAPFLNRELWNLTNSLPESMLMKGWNKKFILKRAFADQFPKGFLEARKKGFGTPVGDWLRTSLGANLKHWCETEKLEQQGLFRTDYVQELVGAHMDGSRDNTYKVWAMFCFQHWYHTVYSR